MLLSAAKYYKYVFNDKLFYGNSNSTCNKVKSLIAFEYVGLHFPSL